MLRIQDRIRLKRASDTPTLRAL